MWTLRLEAFVMVVGYRRVMKGLRVKGVQLQFDSCLVICDSLVTPLVKSLLFFCSGVIWLDSVVVCVLLLVV
jgi:hypothetical protein